VNLIAPITVSDNVLIAAGSTVTKDIPKGAMAIARNYQVNKEDYARFYLSPNKKSE
jgi:bifunctional UDP-N-acetylglucosamine pyrophosphorylase/glucosamine-1-phosphate N-acetyltransferase